MTVNLLITTKQTNTNIARANWESCQSNKAVCELDMTQTWPTTKNNIPTPDALWVTGCTSYLFSFKGLSLQQSSCFIKISDAHGTQMTLSSHPRLTAMSRHMSPCTYRSQCCFLLSQKCLHNIIWTCYVTSQIGAIEWHLINPTAYTLWKSNLVVHKVRNQAI